MFSGIGLIIRFNKQLYFRLGEVLLCENRAGYSTF